MIKPESTDAEIAETEIAVLDQMIAEIQSNRVQLELTERKLQIVRDALSVKFGVQLTIDFGNSDKPQTL